MIIWKKYGGGTSSQYTVVSISAHYIQSNVKASLFVKRYPNLAGKRHVLSL